jgi:UDP-N-acetylmuramoylalanine--D-glutamate ligase
MTLDVQNKKVTVVGLGNSGLNAALLLDDVGAFVRITERADNADVRKDIERLEHRDIDLEIGSHTKAFVEGSSLVVASPGVEEGALPIQWAKALGIPIIGEMELGFRFCKGRVIGITGTNGKSTVTALIGEILKDAGLKTVVCGNIGNALSGEVGRISPEHWVVLEVSSFQLERIEEFRPHIALILNVTDDHQDRYHDFGTYFNEKLKIFKNQGEGDYLILNYDAPNLRDPGLGARSRSKVLFTSTRGRTNGAFTEGGKVSCAAGAAETEVCDVADIRLKGLHNLENVLASCLAGALAGASPGSMRDTVKRFKGLAHRFETVGFINGVEFVDDSKGTTVDSTRRALESSKKPVLLIAGGRDKNSDYTAIRDVVKRRVKCLVLIGEAKNKIAHGLRDMAPMAEARTMDEAVERSFKLARRGDMVLLSPMCSSFDMFKDYAHRGRAFKEAVGRLKESTRKTRVKP